MRKNDLYIMELEQRIIELEEGYARVWYNTRLILEGQPCRDMDECMSITEKILRVRK